MQNIVINMSVAVCLCLHISKTTCPN